MARATPVAKPRAAAKVCLLPIPTTTLIPVLGHYACVLADALSGSPIPVMCMGHSCRSGAI